MKLGEIKFSKTACGSPLSKESSARPKALGRYGQAVARGSGFGSRALASVRDLVYPPRLYCICCGKTINESYNYSLCDHCMSHIGWYKGEEIPQDQFPAYSCAKYGIYERTIVFKLKYNGHKYIAKELAEILYDRLSLEDWDYDVIIPVPMFHKKQSRRGFNQAALMGQYLSALAARPCWPGALVRVSDTKAMRGLGPEERRANVAGQFQVAPGVSEMVQSKSVLLLDDIYTTGSTTRECGLALSRAGAANVYIMAFAAGRDDFDESEKVKI